MRLQLGRMLIASEGRAIWDKPYEHLIIFGGTGSGKSVLLEHVIEAVEEENAGCIVLDPAGSLSKKFIDNSIYIHKNNPISLNPLTRDYLEWTELAEEVKEVLNTATSITTDDRQMLMTVLMGRILANAVRVGFNDLKAIRDFFDRPDLRYQHSDNYWKYFDKKDEKGWYVDKERVDSIKRIAARLSTIVDKSAVYRFVKGNNSFDLQDIALNKKRLIFNFSKFAKFDKAFLGGLITMFVRSYYTHIADENQNAPPLYFIIDEAHQFFNADYEDMFVEARKYNLSIVCTAHVMSQFQKGMEDIIDKSITTKVLIQPKYKAIAVIDGEKKNIRLYPPKKPTQKTVNWNRQGWIVP